MSIEECKLSTIDHIHTTQKYIKKITDELTNRGINHDASKLESPEVEIFAQNTKKLARLKFQENGTMSQEYQDSLNNMQAALDHHYATNRHHPQHFPEGVDGMDLVDLVEMLCDWKAASMRQNNCNLLQSIEANAKRFGISKHLLNILNNTAKYIDRERLV